ncbi:MAG: CPBP family intramembrane metalloprotease [Anaerolineae bacterium]|nr:CPBP family intramembrane metalloprotease [Anaerolineae bacterium]
MKADTQLTTKRILIFLAFAVGIPWTVTLVTYLTVKTEDLPAALGGLVNYLAFTPAPALANVATRLITREGFRHLGLKPNLRRGWRFYLAAWWLPFLVMIPGALAFYLLFPQSFDPHLTAARVDAIPFPVAGIANPWLLMLAYILEYMVLDGLALSVLAIGEEFGWRAYLLQKLMARFSSGEYAYAASAARKAALLVGVIWSVWHWPGMFLTMTFDPAMTLFHPLVYILTTTSQGVLLAWASLRSGSVWPAAIGHMTILGVSWISAAALKGPANLLGPVPDTLIGGLGFTALALVLLFSRKAFAGLGDTGPQDGSAVAGA